MSKSEDFHEEMFETLDHCKEVLNVKGHDYGRDNFIRAAIIAEQITGHKFRPQDVVACIIGIKIARYRELTERSLTPVNEPLKDTVIDWENYVVLMERERKRYERENNKNKSEGKPSSTKAFSDGIAGT